MRLKTVVAIVLSLFMLVGAGVVATAHAQDRMMAKGVMAKNLVTSLGGYKETEHIPVVFTGQTVEIAPGGQTGRERYLAPNFIYVLEGTLTTDTQGGRTGVAGVQYHSEGQSYSSPVGAWHNHMNNGTTPVKYLLLFVGSPGAPTVEKPKSE